MNFTTITLPNLRYPALDTYTISSIESNQEYELRMATYSNRGLSQMSNTIEILVPTCKFYSKICSLLIETFFLVSTQRRPRVNQINSLPNLDEILENITKTQNPSRIKHTLATPPSSSPSLQKSSDILYLIIGIIAGILLILLLILISMCVLRFLQRKKFICTSSMVFKKFKNDLFLF
jgi:hypothetical protein